MLSIHFLLFMSIYSLVILGLNEKSWFAMVHRNLIKSLKKKEKCTITALHIDARHSSHVRFKNFACIWSQSFRLCCTNFLHWIVWLFCCDFWLDQKPHRELRFLLSFSIHLNICGFFGETLPSCVIILSCWKTCRFLITFLKKILTLKGFFNSWLKKNLL